MQPPMPDFLDDMKTYANKVVAALASGIATITHSVGKLAGRVVSKNNQPNGTAKIAKEVAQNQLITGKSAAVSSKNLNSQAVHNLSRTTTSTLGQAYLTKNSQLDTEQPSVDLSSPPLSISSKSTTEQIETVITTAKDYPFKGYEYGIPPRKQAGSEAVFHFIADDKMTMTPRVKIKGIGSVQNCYTWKQSPSITAAVPETLQKAAVRLPPGLKAASFREMRKEVQEAVTSKAGIAPERAQDLALRLGGITIEATLPYKAGNLLNDNGVDVHVHCIFQTGLNFAGNAGGGIPLSNPTAGSKSIEEYANLNAKAALLAAIKNKSDVLIFNVGIGSGFFAGDYTEKVKQANVDSICSAFEEAKKAGRSIQLIVPEIGFTEAQKDQLKAAGIEVVKADKDAVAALCGRAGLKVSETIAADPMSILGIHGPGLWWETAGSASDEERAAFLSPCYALGYIPIDVYESDKKPKKIAALSEFMIGS